MSRITAKLLSRSFHNVPGKLSIGEYIFEVPLNYNVPDNGKVLNLFARTVEKLERPAAIEKPKEKKQLPWLCFFQGGPGMGCRSPESYPWIHPMLDKGYQILFMDPRGTGLSSTITAATLAKRGTAQDQADYLKFFRADSIVQDAEAIRNYVTAEYPEDQRKWSVIGQSFGGYCIVTYLSKFPEGLREAFICGGLLPLVNGPDAVYERTYKKVIQRNDAFFMKYPEDMPKIERICNILADRKVTLPNGGLLNPRRFLQLGWYFGFHGGLDIVHDVVLRTTSDLDQFDELTRPTLSTIQACTPFDECIIYSILHEPLYCQGTSSNWSADRLLKSVSYGRPIFFTGEMIYKWMFDDYIELKPLKDVAEILATTEEWPPLYDEDQLARNEVPVYCTTYIEDMYVSFDLAQVTAAKIKGCKQSITNTMYHDGIRGKGEEVMRQLLALRDDSID